MRRFSIRATSASRVTVICISTSDYHLQILFLHLLVVWTALAQDTPTEREAAHDVVRKMGEVEKSLDVPSLVAKLTAANPARDQAAGRARELMEKELLALADDITKHPEIGFQETRSVEKLTAYLKQHGFEIT